MKSFIVGSFGSFGRLFFGVVALYISLCFVGHVADWGMDKWHRYQYEQRKASYVPEPELVKPTDPAAYVNVEKDKLFFIDSRFTTLESPTDTVRIITGTRERPEYKFISFGGLKLYQDGNEYHTVDTDEEVAFMVDDQGGCRVVAQADSPNMTDGLINMHFGVVKYLTPIVSLN